MYTNILLLIFLHNLYTLYSFRPPLCFLHSRDGDTHMRIFILQLFFFSYSNISILKLQQILYCQNMCHRALGGACLSDNVLAYQHFWCQSARFNPQCHKNVNKFWLGMRLSRGALPWYAQGSNPSSTKINVKIWPICYLFAIYYYARHYCRCSGYMSEQEDRFSGLNGVYF